jgi:hypothetical protein
MSFFTGMLGFGLRPSVVEVVAPPTTDGEVNSSGGTIREGEQFNVYRAAGELTNITDITINSIAATSVTSVDDNSVQAAAPATGLMYGTYSMRLA